MKSFRAKFDESNLEKRKTSIIIVVLLVLWFALFTTVLPFIHSVKIVLIFIAVLAVITIILAIWSATLMNKKYDVTADDTSVKLISGKKVTELQYSDIVFVDYSIREETKRRYNNAYNRRYILNAQIKLKDNTLIELHKDCGAVTQSRYSSADEMLSAMSDKSEETAMLAFIKGKI